MVSRTIQIPDGFPSSCRTVSCIDTHTTGEPTRIVYKGYPDLQGTLLEQKAQARDHYDHYRTELVLEPRGHWNMYGAVLRPKTELVDAGSAHMGVLFLTNDGYSSMCGHASIALGRFLVDTHDLAIFPKRNELVVDDKTQTTRINLHAPCGLVEVTVPTTKDGQRSDPNRAVSFVSVPSFTVATSVVVTISENHRWPQLGDRTSIEADLAYGGAFFALIEAKNLGFSDGLHSPDLPAMEAAAFGFKASLEADVGVCKLFRHPGSPDLQALFGVIIIDYTIGDNARHPNCDGAETGLCFFADHQVDRSPCGSGVAARAALAHAKGQRSLGQRWAYHNLVSNARAGRGAMIGSVCEEISLEDGGATRDAVRVRVEGFAYYTGFHEFVFEDEDMLEEGFSMKGIASGQE